MKVKKKKQKISGKFNSLSVEFKCTIEVDEKLRKWVDEGNHLPEILKSQEYKNALSVQVHYLL